MNFEAQADGSSILTNDVIAFDPSGQYGWLGWYWRHYTC